MSQPQKYDNSGTLFKNDTEKKPKQPEFSGQVTVQGVDFNVAGTAVVHLSFSRNGEKCGAGRLYKNRPDDKKSEKSPDYGGTVEVGGKELRISGWIKESKTQPGKKFIALAFSEKQEGGAK